MVGEEGGPASAVLVEILTVGTGAPKGVPLPVVKRISWAPAAASPVVDTKSLPGV